MAVYTHITPAQLAGFWALFALPPIARYDGIAGGISNTNYCVTDAGGTKRILTLFEARTPEHDLPYFIGLMQHLAAQGMPCPQPVLARDGSALHRVAGRMAAMVSFLPGAAVPQPSVADCMAAGSLLAQLHLAGATYPARRANSMGPDVWLELLAQSAAGTAAHRALQAYATTLVAAWPEGLPSGAIHADFFPDNTLFTTDGLTGVIDFYFACHAALAYDVALALNAWCATAMGEVLPAAARGFLAGYQTVRPLQAAEITALPLLLQGATLRILATRLYDWTHRPPDAVLTPKDPAAYQALLAYHRAQPEACKDWLT
jgi:homoserine kinase type II